MNNHRKNWGLVRRVYFVAGALLAIGAATSFFSQGSVSPYLYVLAAILVLGVALLASDELLQRVHRIFWRGDWPK